MSLFLYGLNPKNETGKYFEASIHQREPITCMLYMVNEVHKKEKGEYLISQDVAYFGPMFGEGVPSGSTCEKLAECIEQFISIFPEEIKFPIVNEHIAHYYCSRKDNVFIVETCYRPDSFMGRIFLTAKAIDPDNEKDITSKATLEDVLAFVDFLRNCGGFEVD